jgi:hypothetical protein
MDQQFGQVDTLLKDPGGRESIDESNVVLPDVVQAMAKLMARIKEAEALQNYAEYSVAITQAETASRMLTLLTSRLVQRRDKHSFGTRLRQLRRESRQWLYRLQPGNSPK